MALASPHLLISDRDEQVCKWLELHLSTIWQDAQIEARPAEQLPEALAPRAAAGPDLLLLGIDGELPAEDLKCLRSLRRRARRLPIVAIAHGGDERLIAHALQAGASDCLRRESLDTALLSRSLRLALHRAARQAQRSSTARQSGASDEAAARDHIPNYRLLRQLGGSHSATVWLARSEARGLLVALKVGRHIVDDPEVRRQLAEERVALAAIQHPSVVELLDYGVHDGREYLAMEYFPCGDLKQRLRNPLSTASALRYARRIASALQVVHEAGLLHRDLKPHNVMLRADGSVVLIDFGLARALASNTRRTAVGVLRGSPYYMSPEQARGQTLDTRSDLYSLGVVLYEMLAGRRPYTGNSPIELMEQHVTGNRPALPPEMAEYEPLIARFMAVDRDQRVAGATDAMAALEALLGSQTITTIRPVLAHAV